MKKLILCLICLGAFSSIALAAGSAQDECCKGQSAKLDRISKKNTKLAETKQLVVVKKDLRNQ